MHMNYFNAAKQQTASIYLHQLCNANVLNDVQLGREKLFTNPRFMHILLNDDTAYRPFDRPKKCRLRYIHQRHNF